MMNDVIILKMGISSSEAPNVATAVAIAWAIWIARMISCTITLIFRARTTPAHTISPTPTVAEPVEPSLSTSNGLSPAFHQLRNASMGSPLLLFHTPEADSRAAAPACSSCGANSNHNWAR